MMCQEILQAIILGIEDTKTEIEETKDDENAVMEEERE